ncbi:MAG: RdgB/HAM1 family non-canonical purine NTP pyrophosphatase [Lachnospiraceae bacterium]|nr:RdgB/HAM1 family non-canonical purine NTP pyrophosphatase [Lachnospiraceae bacterium]
MGRKKLIFATGNKGKLVEIRMIMSDIDVEVLSLKEAGINTEIIEDGMTFEENAIIKAETIMKETGLLTLADDSGLEVDFLNKEPGVYSARYCGVNTSYRIKNRNIMERLTDVEDEQRTARFVCAIAAAIPSGYYNGKDENKVFEETDVIKTVRATMEGRIGYEERGTNGFGYDPIFFLPEYDCYSAELSLEEKNKISHRGKALRMMKELLISEGIVGRLV